MIVTQQFGKAIEYKVASEMIREGFEIYWPAVDDHGTDMIAMTPKGNLVEVQVKAFRKSAKGGLFADISHTQKDNYYFVFYVEAYNATWIISSADFLKLASVNKKGASIGKYSIDVLSKACGPYCVTDYSTII